MIQTETMTMGERIVVMEMALFQQAATPDEIYNYQLTCSLLDLLDHLP